MIGWQVILFDRLVQSLHSGFDCPSWISQRTIGRSNTVDQLSLVIPEITFLIATFRSGFYVVQCLLQIDCLFSHRVSQFRTIVGIKIRTVQITVGSIREGGDKIVDRFQACLCVLRATDQVKSYGCLVQFLRPSFRYIDIAVCRTQIISRPY